MKMVPTKSGGSSRRGYNRAYHQSAAQKGTSAVLGKTKVSSPEIKPAKIDTGPIKPAKTEQRRGYGKPLPSTRVSFGPTGFTDEDFNLK